MHSSILLRTVEQMFDLQLNIKHMISTVKMERISANSDRKLFWNIFTLYGCCSLVNWWEGFIVINMARLMCLLAVRFKIRLIADTNKIVSNAFDLLSAVSWLLAIGINANY